MPNLLRLAPGFLLGVIVACAAPDLPPRVWSLAGMSMAAVACFIAPRRLVPVAAFVLGATYLWADARSVIDAMWPSAHDGEDVTMRIEVLGLPDSGERHTRFDARVLEADGLATGARLRLNWYAPAPTLHPGDVIDATLRLRRPRGMLNPGGFDFERHALVERIAANGYVREGRVLQDAGSGTIDRLRLHIAEHIDQRVAEPTAAALLKALAIGDVRGLDDDHWDVLRATGTSHLIAISGLHVGLVAAFGAGGLFCLYWCFPRLGLRWPRPLALAVGAVISAMAYAVLAGLGVAVLRTVLMIALALTAVLLRRTIRRIDSLLLAALVIVAFDPLTVLGAGFWLSFIGVAFLLWAVTGAEWRLAGLWRTQVAMSLGLMPVGAWWFAQTSVIGLFTNLVAVPWITFVIVPLALLAMAVDALCGWPGLFLLPAKLLEPLWWLLAKSAESPFAEWHFAHFELWALLFALVGVAYALLPRGVPMRGAALCLVLPLLWPRTGTLREGEFELIVFDVGQGLSALVRTRDHALLFDTGPRFGESSDFGEVVVVPSLHALGLRRLERLVVSHLDDDHSGGRRSVLQAFPEAVQLVGNDADPAARCESGDRWQWDGVDFEFLHPPRHFPDLDNDNSCVLRVYSSAGSALLPGDIGELIEQRLAKTQGSALDVDVVIAAHHGSKHSSSPEFVAATSADAVVFARGWRNRFGHPAPDVVTRWQEEGARIIDTAVQGAVRIGFLADGRTIRAVRDLDSRFWRAHDSDQVASATQ